MTKLGGKKHVKRLAAPRKWPILRKEYVFVKKTSPGPHPKDESIPLIVLIRDVLQLAENKKEVNYILQNGNVMINNKVRKDLGFPVGIMDIIKIARINKYYILLPTRNGLFPFEISEDDAKIKYSKIINKMHVKGGKLQFTTHDGYNFLFDAKEGRQYNTRGTFVVDLETRKILQYIPLEEGQKAFIQSGSNVGIKGTIREIIDRFGPRASTVIIETEDGEEIETAKDYAFVLDEESVIFKIKGEEIVKPRLL